MSLATFMTSLRHEWFCRQMRSPDADPAVLPWWAPAEPHWAVGDPRVSSAPLRDPRVSSTPLWAVGDPILNHPQVHPARCWQSPGRQSLLCLQSLSVPCPAVWTGAGSAGAQGRQSCQNAGMVLLLLPLLLLLWIPGRQCWQEQGQGFTLQIHTRLSSRASAIIIVILANPALLDEGDVLGNYIRLAHLFLLFLSLPSDRGLVIQTGDSVSILCSA